MHVCVCAFEGLSSRNKNLGKPKLRLEPLDFLRDVVAVTTVVGVFRLISYFRNGENKRGVFMVRSQETLY